MVLELSDIEVKKLLALLAGQTTVDPSQPEVIEGLKGYVKSKGQVLCPEMCFRFQEQGKCVHLEKEPGLKPEVRAAYQQMIEDRKAVKVEKHKALERADAKWECVSRDEWKKLPFIHGVYVWVDAKDKMLFVGKAVDMRRRHFGWVSSKDKRFDPVAKIWWLNTGWYNEMLAALELLEKGSWITRELLEEVLMMIRPIDALIPEPPSL